MAENPEFASNIDLPKMAAAPSRLETIARILNKHPKSFRNIAPLRSPDCGTDTDVTTVVVSNDEAALLAAFQRLGDSELRKWKIGLVQRLSAIDA